VPAALRTQSNAFAHACALDLSAYLRNDVYRPPGPGSLLERDAGCICPVSWRCCVRVGKCCPVVWGWRKSPAMQEGAEIIGYAWKYRNAAVLDGPV